MMVLLEYSNPRENHFRFYRLEVQKSLFGEWSLIRNWGRVGSWGRTVINTYASQDKAIRACHQMTHDKIYRGYVLFVDSKTTENPYS